MPGKGKSTVSTDKSNAGANVNAGMPTPWGADLTVRLAQEYVLVERDLRRPLSANFTAIDKERIFQCLVNKINR